MTCFSELAFFYIFRSASTMHDAMIFQASFSIFVIYQKSMIGGMCGIWQSISESYVPIPLIQEISGLGDAFCWYQRGSILYTKNLFEKDANEWANSADYEYHFRKPTTLIKFYSIIVGEPEVPVGCQEDFSCDTSQQRSCCSSILGTIIDKAPSGLAWHPVFPSCQLDIKGHSNTAVCNL